MIKNNALMIPPVLFGYQVYSFTGRLCRLPRQYPVAVLDLVLYHRDEALGVPGDSARASSWRGIEFFMDAHWRRSARPPVLGQGSHHGDLMSDFSSSSCWPASYMSKLGKLKYRPEPADRQLVDIRGTRLPTHVHERG